MTILLETKRLIIRESSSDNFENVFALFSDKEVMHYVGRGVMTREEAHAKLEKMIQHQNKHGFSFGDVYEKESHYYIGRAGLIYLEMNDQQPQIEIGYLLYKEFWKKGYATELAQALINWGFNHLKLKKIVAVLKPENDASRHVLEKMHMYYVGKAFHYDIEVAKYEIINDKIDPALIRWDLATLDDYSIIQNMNRFCIYDVSEFMRNESGWPISSTGLYESTDIRKYWENKDAMVFIIRYEDELAGFIVIEKKKNATYIDFNIVEFFVLRKFKSRNLDCLLAEQCFAKFPGVWEINVLSGNEGSYRFWRNVIKKYTNGQFMEYTCKDGEVVKNFFKFRSR